MSAPSTTSKYAWSFGNTFWIASMSPHGRLQAAMSTSTFFATLVSSNKSALRMIFSSANSTKPGKKSVHRTYLAPSSADTIPGNGAAPHPSSSTEGPVAPVRPPEPRKNLG
eukprot:CAMPEP_0179002374 /NCGR_PEP_ID=MMETSP0795-20121207/11970_1 /TAXON_ID=88552 /ORGANISM="Amoebophrya sp., Strain Ameob2" /LENGTH=110 /DNA_ID=CAMNT_0020696031 /DNA_START=299 /DNA_END=627 /DNA_ORIENTATION=+